MLIDTHAHLDFEQFEDIVPGVLANAKKAGVEKIINVSTSLAGIRDSLKLAAEYPQVYASVGIHPNDVQEATGETMAEVLEHASGQKVVAVGETGVDYFRVSGLVGDERAREVFRKNQLAVFRKHLIIAKQTKLPVIIHCRPDPSPAAKHDAFRDAFEILAAFNHSLPGVFHSFAGNTEQVKKAMELNFYISFTGIITFPKTEELGNVVKEVPLEKILLETDSPFLAPQGKRGQTNEPAFVLEIAQKIAEIKGISLDEVASQTTKNATELFKL